MRKLVERPIFRSMVAAVVTFAALLSNPQSLHASGNCHSECLWSCPTDKFFYCRVLGGPQCGFSANCAPSPSCGALMIQIDCTGFEE